MKTITMTSQFKELLEEKENENRFSKIVFAAMLVLLCIFTGLNVDAQKYKGRYLNNVDENGVIINGYDPVAFFTDNKPVKGDPSFKYNYEEATYYFASQEHLDLFKNDPEKYKPQFGAWCAYAVSLGRTAPIDVNTFSIVNGRLVIQHNKKAVKGWNENVQGNLKLADKYWPEVTANGGKQIHTNADTTMILWISIAAIVVVLITYSIVSRSGKSKRIAQMKSKRLAMAEGNTEDAFF